MLEFVLEIVLSLFGFCWDRRRSGGSDSRVGDSEFERETSRFWLKCGIVLTVLAIMGALIWDKWFN
ncbi:MAG: hypothetical protein EOP86_09875 [Verrucomicrobiaceae bacterium]|nr:MAG: hypothetical protein EOP86_09875 [Verrucomicrobiaceae bacterium]